MGKLKRCFTPLLATAVILSFAGCATSPPPSVDEQAMGAPEVRVPQDESFDPLSLDDEDYIKLPESKLKSPSTGGTQEGSVREDVGGSGLEEVLGYRVQIFVSDQEFDARTMEEKALIEFDEPVYLIFDSPNYKVRVGDFRSRAEANTLRQKAVKMGYKDAWVVQSKVKLSDR